MSTIAWALPEALGLWNGGERLGALRTLARVVAAVGELLAFAYGLRTCARGIRRPGSAAR